MTEADTYPTPEHGWVCFHCGEHFPGDIPGSQAARAHFGDHIAATPACQIWGPVKGWRCGYRKLIRALRAAQRERDETRRALIDDDTAKDRYIYGLEAKHHSALRDAEETGYARGLADGRAWEPLAKALFSVERNPDIKDQAWFDFQGKAQRIVAAMQAQ